MTLPTSLSECIRHNRNVLPCFVGLFSDYHEVVEEARAISWYTIIAAALSILLFLILLVVVLNLRKIRLESGRKDQEIGLLKSFKESEERYRTLFDGVENGVFISTPEGRFLEVNNAMVRMLGYACKEDLLGIDISSQLYFSPEDRKRFMDEVDRKGVINDFENRLCSKNSQPVICLETSYGRRDEAGKVIEYLGIMVDITHRKVVERELAERNNELRILHDVSKVINQSLDLDEILRIALEKTLAVTPFDMCGIYIHDEENQTLNLGAAIGLPAGMHDKVRTIPMGETLTGEIARDRKIVFIESLSGDKRSQMTKAGVDLQAFVGIPLLYGDRLMGVMNIASHNRLSSEECRVDLLKGVSELIAVAIGNARLYRDARERAAEMKVLYEAGRSFMALTDLECLARMVVEVAMRELGNEGCHLFVLDGKGNLSIAATECRQRQEGCKIESGGLGDTIIGWVAANKVHGYVSDVLGDRRFRPGCSKRRSELAIPLLVGEKFLGVIDFEKLEVNSYSEEGIRFLSLFSNQVAWAIYNARLFEEIRKANEDLNRASELKSEFVSLVSHELRTPMTAIKGALDIIHSGVTGPLSEKQRSFIGMARRNIQRLNELINNILDLSRIEAGKITYEFQEVNLQKPLNQVMLTLAVAAEEKKIALESRIPSSFPILYADEAKVEQILTNLIGNALKFTPPAGKITVFAGPAREEDAGRIPGGRGGILGHQDFVKVSVVDTGGGIPPDQLENIFVSFEQLNGNKGERGTGLGLTICRYLVEGHGGAIWAESQLGQGSVLSFLLPVFQRGRQQSAVEQRSLKGNPG